jgi:hypothetical protein
MQGELESLATDLLGNAQIDGADITETLSDNEIRLSYSSNPVSRE